MFHFHLEDYLTGCNQSTSSIAEINYKEIINNQYANSLRTYLADEIFKVKVLSDSSGFETNNVIAYDEKGNVIFDNRVGLQGNKGAVALSS